MVGAYKGRLFQWKAGEREGQYEVVDRETHSELVFESGATVMKSQLSAYLTEHAIPGADPPEAPPARSAPEAVPQEHASVGAVPAPVALAAEPSDADVIRHILGKQRQNDRIDVVVRVPVPTRQVRRVLESMYDEDVVGRIISESVTEGLKGVLVEESTLDTVAEAVKNHYGRKDADQ